MPKSESEENGHALMMTPEAVNTYDGPRDSHALILRRAQTGIQAFGT